MRGNGLYRVVPLVALVASLALSSCRVFDYEQREPWRLEAEEKCLAEKLVQPSAYVEPESSINGRGACGMVHPFKVAAMNGGMVEVSPKATLACPVISELDRWIADSVQRSAVTWFGEQVVEIRQISAYSCRGMNGQPGAHISEHAFGNALDIAAFKLQSGHEIVIKKAWKNGSYEERGFLRDVAMDACERFATVLAPGSNVYHYDHIHLDLSRRASGNTYCKPQVARLTPPNRAYARGGPASRGQQVAQLPQHAPAYEPAPRANYSPRRNEDLSLGGNAPRYEPQYAPAQNARTYPQAQRPLGNQSTGGQPMQVAPQPSYGQPGYAEPAMRAPAYAPEPQYPAADPYRPLPPRNVGAKRKSDDDIVTASVGKDRKKKPNEKTSHKKTAPAKAHAKQPPHHAVKHVAPKPAPRAAEAKPAARKPAPAKPVSMTSSNLLSPVPIASQGNPPSAKSVGDATLKALKN
jgi:hypothetical protein